MPSSTSSCRCALPRLYTLPRQADGRFYLNQFDAEAIVIGPRDMVLVTPRGQRVGLGLAAPAESPWVRVYPYQHWSLAIFSRPFGDLAGYEGIYQVVDQNGNPVPGYQGLGALSDHPRLGTPSQAGVCAP